MLNTTSSESLSMETYLTTSSRVLGPFHLPEAWLKVKKPTGESSTDLFNNTAALTLKFFKTVRHPAVWNHDFILTSEGVEVHRVNLSELRVYKKQRRTAATPVYHILLDQETLTLRYQDMRTGVGRLMRCKFVDKIQCSQFGHQLKSIGLDVHFDGPSPTQSQSRTPASTRDSAFLASSPYPASQDAVGMRTLSALSLKDWGNSQDNRSTSQAAPGVSFSQPKMSGGHSDFSPSYTQPQGPPNTQGAPSLSSTTVLSHEASINVAQLDELMMPPPRQLPFERAGGVGRAVHQDLGGDEASARNSNHVKAAARIATVAAPSARNKSNRVSKKGSKSSLSSSRRSASAPKTQTALQNVEENSITIPVPPPRVPATHRPHPGTMNIHKKTLKSSTISPMVLPQIPSFDPQDIVPSPDLVSDRLERPSNDTTTSSQKEDYEEQCVETATTSTQPLDGDRECEDMEPELGPYDISTLAEWYRINRKVKEAGLSRADGKQMRDALVEDNAIIQAHPLDPDLVEAWLDLLESTEEASNEMLEAFKAAPDEGTQIRLAEEHDASMRVLELEVLKRFM